MPTKKCEIRKSLDSSIDAKLLDERILEISGYKVQIKIGKHTENDTGKSTKAG